MLRFEREHEVGERTRSTALLVAACAYVATIPFDLFAVIGGRTATIPATGILFVVWLNDLNHTKRRTSVGRGAGLPIFIYVVWCLITALWSVNPDVSLLKWTSLGLQVLTAFILADALGGHWRNALWSYACASAGLAALLLANPLDTTRGGRGSVGGADENITAFVLSIGFAAAIYLAAESRGWLRPLAALLVAGVAAAGVVYTGSRTGFLSVVAIMVVTALLLRGRMSTGRRLVLIALALPAYQLLVSMGLVPDRVASAFSDTVQREDSGRSDIIAMYREHFSDWAMTGIGYGTDADFLLLAAGEYRNAHSMFWKTWIEVGFIGLLLLGVVIVALYRTGRLSPSRGAALLLLAPVTLFAITLGGQTSNALWFVVALALVRTSPVEDQPVPADTLTARRSRARTRAKRTARAAD